MQRPHVEHPELPADSRTEFISRFNEINAPRFGGHLGYRLVVAGTGAGDCLLE